MIFRLPDGSRIKTTDEMREREAEARSWTVETELLAQIREDISILAADRRRKKVVDVPRPEHLTRRGRRRQGVKAGQPNPEGFAHAIGVLKTNARPPRKP